MYRAPAQDPVDDEPLTVPVRSVSIWLTVLLLAVVGLAIGGGLVVVRLNLTQDQARAPVPTGEPAPPTPRLVR